MDETNSDAHGIEPQPDLSHAGDSRADIAKWIGIIGIFSTLLLCAFSINITINRNWVPAGYTITSQDSNVAYKWVTNENTCDSYSCVWASFISRTGCLSSFYVAVNVLDFSDKVYGFNHSSLPSLQPMQYAKLRFDIAKEYSPNVKSAQLSEVQCR
jgi:hypothetical protein